MVSRTFRSVDERTRFATGLKAWRHQKLLETLKVYDMDADSIMTDKELDHLAKTLGITSPAEQSWRLELLGVLQDLQTVEDQRVAALAEKSHIKAATAAHALEEKRKRVIEAKHTMKEEMVKHHIMSPGNVTLASQNRAPCPPVPSGSSLNVIQTAAQPHPRAVGVIHITANGGGYPSPVTLQSAHTSLSPMYHHVQPQAGPSSQLLTSSTPDLGSFHNAHNISTQPGQSQTLEQKPLAAPINFTWVVEDPTRKKTTRKRKAEMEMEKE